MIATETLESLLRSFQEINFPELEIMGPAPAPLAKIKNYYRWQILLKSPDPSEIRKLINMAFEKLPSQISKGEVAVTIDMDPMAIL